MSALPFCVLPKLNIALRTIMWEKGKESQSTLIELLGDLHTHDGCVCITSPEDNVSQPQTIADGTTVPSQEKQFEPLYSPWVAFIQDADAAAQFADASLEHCLGVFMSSETTQQNLLDKLSPRIPYCRYRKPVPAVEQKFRFSVQNLTASTQRKLISFGRSLLFFNISVPSGWQKYSIESSLGRHEEKSYGNVVVIDPQPANRFRQLLTDSVLFLNIEDTEINEVLLRCIAHHTPLIVNRALSAVDYLGEDYPLYFDSRKEVNNASLLEVDLLAKASDYMAYVSQKIREKFIRDIQNSAIYRSLPTPPSQRKRSQRRSWRAYDLTILICTYTRTQNLSEILKRLYQQDFKGSFEVIIWNNNEQMHEFVESVCARYSDQLNLKLQLSSENYYCMPRLSIAHLMQSNILVTCDDDILPEPPYISRFIKEHKEYGEGTVLCCSGHSFVPHQLDDENPDHFWSKEECTLKTFHDRTGPVSEVHFFHGHSSLIPRNLLLLVTTYQLPDPGFALVDDYWMSFVLSHHLRIPIWKINAQSMISFDKSAFDPQKAMCYDAIVREQRVSFYIYHMQQGWPFETVEIEKEGNKQLTRETPVSLLPSGSIVIDHYSH